LLCLSVNGRFNVWIDVSTDPGIFVHHLYRYTIVHVVRHGVRLAAHSARSKGVSYLAGGTNRHRQVKQDQKRNSVRESVGMKLRLYGGIEVCVLLLLVLLLFFLPQVVKKPGVKN